MNILVTGGSRGIGREIREVFTENGHNVIAPPRSELDLSDPASVNEYTAKNADSDLDVIINNAGINPVNYIENIRETDIAECVQVNMLSPLLLIKGLTARMKARKHGYIINIGSVWGVVSKEKRTLYSMTKNGIHGLTNALAAELGEYNILVNTVCPGFTKTELTAQNVGAEEEKELCKSVPLGRFARPREIAELVYFLGSERNTYITGQKIIIDGGFTAK